MVEKQKLLIELESIQKRGVTIFLEGVPSNPLSVTDVLCVCEEKVYMRDYVINERGELTELRFDHVRNL